MGKTILFSPVGGTDPISNSNCQDGALLHICRVYQPDEVYMYMSQYVIDLETQDSRYTYCLKKLYEKIGKELIYHKIERPELSEVHDFNYFYDDFRNELNRIRSDMGEDDVLLLNMSSGTPAMKSPLVVLVTLGDVKGKLIQVVTPEGRINTHKHDNYDVKTLWELNPDNEDGFANRCTEVHCPSLAAIKNEELIKKLVRSYDYVAAYEVAQMMDSSRTGNYIHLLEYAVARMNLDYSSMDKIEAKHGLKSMLSVRTTNYRNAFEYASILFIKEKKGEYTDFLRGLTPLILELYILVLRKYTGIDAREYCYKDKKTTGYKWDLPKANSNPITKKWLDVLEKQYSKTTRERPAFKAGYLQSIHLLYIIEAFCNKTIYRKAELLRTVEENARNNAAHEIKIMTSEIVKKKTGQSCESIIQTIKSLYSDTGVSLPQDAWNSFDDMNEYIIEQMSSVDS